MCSAWESHAREPPPMPRTTRRAPTARCGPSELTCPWSMRSLTRSISSIPTPGTPISLVYWPASSMTSRMSSAPIPWNPTGRGRPNNSVADTGCPHGPRRRPTMPPTPSSRSQMVCGRTCCAPTRNSTRTRYTWCATAWTPGSSTPSPRPTSAARSAWIRSARRWSSWDASPVRRV